MQSTHFNIGFKIFFLTISTFVLIGPGCKKDLVNCQDEKVGDIFFTKNTAAFLPLTGNEKLVFIDATGTEMRFQCNQPAVGRFRCNVENHCTGPDLTPHFKYLESDTKSLYFQTPSSTAPVNFTLTSTLNNALVKTENETALFENFACTFFDGTVGGSLVNIILDQRGSDPLLLKNLLDAQSYRAIADTTILGKQFTELFAGKPISGTPAGSKTVVYYQKNKGIAAFSMSDGRVWVYDRTE